ncbi:exonuclease/endonuclease/phosphatase family protein [Labilibacter marinus]|uniref:hypothetical protein n=1 Tax=Labilibacter marinus TaxID=1477105 RepID=UPI0008329766|nr:hypothetical protein [Labilibacter marinus]
MKVTGAIWVCLLLIFASCNNQGKKVSISTIKFNCKYTSNPVHINQPYFDTLQVFISKLEPDLISFKETIFSDNCKSVIEAKGYQFIPIHHLQSDSNIFYSPIVYKSTSFTLLGSSFYIFKKEYLEKDKNIVSWFQLKNIQTGHVFYLFNLQLQRVLNNEQSEFIAYEVLRRIDNVSAGLPVILIGDFFSQNTTLRKVLINNWKGIYPLNEVNIVNGEISEFLVNDFFDVITSSVNTNKDSLVNNVEFKFSTQKIKRNKSGNTIPE